MGDDILILAFVIIVIGGIGSIKGAFIAAMVVGQIDIVGRAFLPDMLKTFMSSSAASSAAPAISQVLVYVLMAVVLVGARPACSASAHDGRSPHAARDRDGPDPAGAGGPAAAHPGIRPALPAVDRHAHRHLVDRRGQPQHDPGLWRACQFRPRDVLRHRRLCGRHPVGRGHLQRLDPVAGRPAGGDGVGGPDRRAVAPDARPLLHHDHIGFRPARLLRGQRTRSLWRRRRAQHQPQPLPRPDRPARQGELLLAVLCLALRQPVVLRPLRQLPFRSGAPRRQVERAAHDGAGLPGVPLPLGGVHHLRCVRRPRWHPARQRGRLCLPP